MGDVSDDAQKVHARRLVTSKLGDNQVIQRLFDEIAPRFATTATLIRDMILSLSHITMSFPSSRGPWRSVTSL